MGGLIGSAAGCAIGSIVPVIGEEIGCAAATEEVAAKDGIELGLFAFGAYLAGFDVPELPDLPEIPDYN